MSALFVAWRSGKPDGGVWGPVGRLEHADNLFRFWYTKGAHSLEGFRPFPGMSDLQAVYTSEELFPLFANRLLAESRPEYKAFIRWVGLDTSEPPDPIAVLGVTEGIRQTDAVEVFPCPAPDLEGCYFNKFFLHGIRWMEEEAIERIDSLPVGEYLIPRAEPDNENDANAVAVFTSENEKIGYVPRYFAHDVKKVLEDCGEEVVDIFVERVNVDAPLQFRVLCRMEACWPEDLKPCSTEVFQPIPSDVPTECS